MSEQSLIDANKVIANLVDEYHGMISDESLKIYEIIRLLVNEPTIDPESLRPHGRWVRPKLKPTYRIDAPYYKCSSCGETEDYISQYCPNCGAKMDLEEKE